MPAIGLSVALEQARWGPWDTAAHVLARSYSDAVQRAGRDRGAAAARSACERRP